LSLVETIGFDSWNIDMVHHGSVVDQVADRLERLDELSELRTAVKPLWRDMYANMAATFGNFAGDVRRFQAALETTTPSYPRLAKAA
jgi:hypothetical protein